MGDILWAEESLQVTQLSQSAAIMEVPRRWRFWTGWEPMWWNPYRSQWSENFDPVDVGGYDDATAFPALKPDKEVFHVGVPSYTRTQRGWYHVKSWPPLPTAAGVHHVPNNEATTGADVPPELFDIILSHVQLPGQSCENALCMKKEDLGRLSLVCRRWAKFLLPRIFSQITLRSRDDSVMLVSLLRHPHSHIKHHIETIIAELPTCRPYEPWAHDVSALLQFVKTEIATVHIALHGPLPAGEYVKGVRTMLPRSVPWLFSGVTRLELRDLHFRKAEDLLRIPRDLPSLEEVVCDNVTWDHTSSEEISTTLPYLSRSSHLSNSGVTYTIRRCVDNIAAAWFAVFLAPRWRDRLERNEAHQICRILSVLVQNIDSARFLGCEVEATRCKDYLCFYTRNRGPSVGDWDFVVPTVEVFLTSPAPGEARRVQAIQLNLPLEGYVNSATRLANSDWKAFDTLVVALPRLEAVLINSFSRQDVLRFHKEVVIQRMPYLQRSAQLKYALKRGDGSCGYGVDYTLLSCTEGTVRRIGDPVDSPFKLF
ncbi:hypothetical protein NM688_g1231 [Phlebia brevispora]|uniref:Uncharacterized protein n=1 Tax=Phlebia brevispora TaxID=194682 RepID=A0ACC1TBV4_9APHY|nr:hypothetical protein NM688_g1231 [Phlebia brevispora]